MSGKPDPKKAPPKVAVTGRAAALGLVIILLAVWAGTLWLRDSSPQQRLQGLAVGSVAKFEFFDAPKTLPETPFADRDGHAATLASFRGKTVLVNFWATWCEPCRVEMPSLARLQTSLGGETFAVVTIALDLEGYPVLDAFLAEIGVTNLPVYWDRSNRLPVELETKGLPMTIIIDRGGRWIGRLDGPAEWDTAEALALLRAAARD